MKVSVGLVIPLSDASAHRLDARLDANGRVHESAGVVGDGLAVRVVVGVMVEFDRDKLECALVQWTAAEEKPILAICRGLQIMNVALGGTLWQDLATGVPSAAKHDCYPNHPRDKRTHSLAVTQDSRLA